MARVRILAAAAMAVLLGTAGLAHAETAKPRAAAAPAAAEGLSVRGDFNAQAAAAQPNKVLQWDTERGRWGLKFDVGSRGSQWKNVDVGAYFRVTPSLRVGGAVGLETTKDVPVRTPDEQPAAPKVRLETAFKF